MQDKGHVDATRTIPLPMLLLLLLPPPPPPLPPPPLPPPQTLPCGSGASFELQLTGPIIARSPRDRPRALLLPPASRDRAALARALAGVFQDMMTEGVAAAKRYVFTVHEFQEERDSKTQDGERQFTGRSGCLRT